VSRSKVTTAGVENPGKGGIARKERTRRRSESGVGGRDSSGGGEEGHWNRKKGKEHHLGAHRKESSYLGPKKNIKGRKTKKIV